MMNRPGQRRPIDRRPATTTASGATTPTAPRPAGLTEAEQDVPLTPGHDLDAVAVLVHTSGTTGAPRRVGLTYGNWLWSALGSAAALGHPPGERWLCTLPLSHVGGLSILVRSAAMRACVAKGASSPSVSA